MARQSKAEKQIEARITRVYGRSCHGSILIQDIPKVFKVGREAIAAGADDGALETKLREFFATVRQG